MPFFPRSLSRRAGYGVASGTANEASVNRCVEAAFTFLTRSLKIPEDTIVVMGRSIGTGPAIACSVRHPDVAGLIVMSAFTSISGTVHYRNDEAFIAPN